MKKVITYGTYDLLHQGHINLLKRAKALGDYLIVGVTTDNFDISRGKLNVCENLMDRISNIKKTNLADQIIIEEYAGQKIDDIQKYNVDIFAIGSDWEGKFDYLNEFCKVVYLPRTEGISSTLLRSRLQVETKIGIIGSGRMASRFVNEAGFVNGLKISHVFNPDIDQARNFVVSKSLNNLITVCSDFDQLIDNVEAVYVASPHKTHYQYIKQAIIHKKHVLCEIPMVLDSTQCKELIGLANVNQVLLMEAHKTAFCPAFCHLITLIKSGMIGEIVDIDASISSLVDDNTREMDASQAGGSITENCSFALLPIFKLLGTKYTDVTFFSKLRNNVDIYTRGVLAYKNAIASFKVGLGVKTEGSLVVSGTKGYAYVPSPWWKTDYFELRYEDINKNRKYFYPYDGDGLRYEIKEFITCIQNNRLFSPKLTANESISMADIIEKYRADCNITIL